MTERAIDAAARYELRKKLAKALRPDAFKAGVPPGTIAMLAAYTQAEAVLHVLDNMTADEVRAAIRATGGE